MRPFLREVPGVHALNWKPLLELLQDKAPRLTGREIAELRRCVGEGAPGCSRWTATRRIPAQQLRSRHEDSECLHLLYHIQHAATMCHVLPRASQRGTAYPSVSQMRRGNDTGAGEVRPSLSRAEPCPVHSPSSSPSIGGFGVRTFQVCLPGNRLI